MDHGIIKDDQAREDRGGNRSPFPAADLTHPQFIDSIERGGRGFFSWAVALEI